MIRPYIYVFDADTAAGGSPLANGADFRGLSVNVESCDRFVLTRMCGVQNVASRIKLYDWQRYGFSSNPVYPALDTLFIPSPVYPVDSAISFDLFTTALANRPTAATPNYYSQIAFQGQKHLPGTDLSTPYRWKPLQQLQVASLTLDWPGRIAPGDTVLDRPRQFSYEFDNYDFELHQIRIFRTGQAANTPADTDFKIQLYDASMNPLSNAPVLVDYINAGSNTLNSQFPAPVLLFPVGSRITYDIWSLQTAGNLPRTFEIQMLGVWRYPC